MKIATILLFGVLAGGGYFWHKTEFAATARSESVADPFSEDDEVTAAFSAEGYLNQTVRVVVYDFGVEDKAAEDVYADQILHDRLSKVLYDQGFRRVVIPGLNISQPIMIAPASAATRKNESRTLSARAIG